MGLFGFVKDIGRKLFNRDEEAAEKIKEHILANNPGVKNLEITFENGIVGLSGECTNKEAYQKCVLMAGNVKGVIDVYATGLKPYVAPAATPAEKAPAPEPEPKEEYYVIVKGDTLSAIARKYYGNANKWPRLFEANREVILDPDKIFPGQKIRIPLD